MILDVLSLVIVLVFIFIGAKTGAAKVVFRLLAVVCSFLLALFLSRFLAELVYNAFIRQTIIDNINNVINDSALSTVSEKSAELFASLPHLLTNSLAYFGITQASVADMLGESAVTGIEEVIMTPVVGVISLVFFVVLFVILLFVLKRVFRGLSKIFRLPLIRVVDSLFGLVLGFLEGIFAMGIFAFLLKIIIPLTGGEVYIINEAYIAQSYVFSLFYFGDIISIVQSFIYSFSNI